MTQANTYTEWEIAVTEQIAEEGGFTYGDAAGIVEGQPFVLQQAWTLGLDAQQAAAKIIAAATSA